ncbi:hypothetical protein VPH35_115513 [Triticum aestivum]
MARPSVSQNTTSAPHFAQFPPKPSHVPRTTLPVHGRPPPNSGDQAIDPPGKVKKKAAKGSRKPRSECTLAELAKLDADSAKRRNRRAVVKGKNAAAMFAAERDALEATRRKAEVDEKEDIVNKAHALLMLGICRPAGFSAAPVFPASTGSSFARPPHFPSPTLRTTPLSPGFPPTRYEGQTRFSGSPDVGVIAPSTPRPSAVIDLNVTSGSSSGGRPSVEMQRKQARLPSTGTMPSPRVLFDEMPTLMPTVDDPFYNQLMENVIYEGGHGGAYDPDETQSQDGRAQYVADEDNEAHDHANYDHGDSWHEDDDIYCEGDGDEEEGIDIGGEPLFIDELTQRAEAQKRKKSIHTGSYSQEEDKLICQSWMEISQDPRTDQYRGLQRKRGKKTVALAGGGDGEALKMLRGKTNSKDVRDEKKRQSKDEQMNQYLELERKKLEMEEAAKKRKIDMEEASRQRQLDIEAANVTAR